MEHPWHGRDGIAEWSHPRCISRSEAEARPGYDTEDASEYLDSSVVLKAKVKMLAQKIRRSHQQVVYSGAGLSTASGTPDYASRSSSSIAPHLKGNRGVPKRAIGSCNRLDAEPTAAHCVLATLWRKKLLQHWLQQNHDRLAQKAGFPQTSLNEIHGAWGDAKNPVLMMDDDLRPDLLEWMEQWGLRADLCMAVGTSLCGMTADCVAQATAKRHAAGEGDGLVIINLQKTSMDGDASLRIWGLLDDVFRLLAGELRLGKTALKPSQEGEKWTASHPRCVYNTPKRKASDKQ